MSVLLQQFARAPVPGRVKTRMQPALSPSEACALHEQLVLWTTRSLLQAQLGAVELWTAGGVDHADFIAEFLGRLHNPLAGLGLYIGSAVEHSGNRRMGNARRSSDIDDGDRAL